MNREQCDKEEFVKRATEERFSKDDVLWSLDGDYYFIISFETNRCFGDIYRVRDENDQKKLMVWYKNEERFEDTYQKVCGDVNKGAPGDMFIWPESILKNIDSSFGYILPMERREWTGLKIRGRLPIIRCIIKPVSGSSKSVGKPDSKKRIAGIVFVFVGIVFAFLSYKMRFMEDYDYYTGVIDRYEDSISEYKGKQTAIVIKASLMIVVALGLVGGGIYLIKKNSGGTI